MDNGIVLIAALVASIIVGSVVWLALRRNLPPDVSLELAAYVAAIRAAVGDVVDSALVTTLAGYAWDSWGSASKYITRDDFIAYVLRAFEMEPSIAAQITTRQARAAGVPKRPEPDTYTV